MAPSVQESCPRVFPEAAAFRRGDGVLLSLMLGSGAMRAVRWGCVLALLFLCAGVPPVRSAIPPDPPHPSDPDEAEDDVADPLGRLTPRGALRGFQRAARTQSWSLAAQYLDLGGRRRARGLAPAELAEQLHTVLERKLWVPIPT